LFSIVKALHTKKRNKIGGKLSVASFLGT